MSVAIPSPTKSVDSRVSALIGVVAASAAGGITFALPAIAHTVSADPRRVASMLALTLVLQLFSVPVYGRGGFGVSAIGILAAAFLLNTGTAMAVAVVVALVQLARRRTDLDKAIFDAGNLALAAGAAGLTFHALDGASRLLAAAVAGCVYAALNNGLVCLAMSLAEKTDWRAVWQERFHWARFYFLLFGPLALVARRRTSSWACRARRLHGAAGADDALRAPVPRADAAAVDEMREANVRLRRAHRDTIAALSRSMEAKDLYTGGHTGRVAAVSVGIARRLGFATRSSRRSRSARSCTTSARSGSPSTSCASRDARRGRVGVIETHPVVSDYILSELDLIRSSANARARATNDRRRRLSGRSQR